MVKITLSLPKMEVAPLLIILAPPCFYAGLVNQSREPDRQGHIAILKKPEEAYRPEDSMSDEMI
ncbi:MAG: hypothetical protein ACQETA_09335 [Bacteroidota bacterium]